MAVNSQNISRMSLINKRKKRNTGRDLSKKLESSSAQRVNKDTVLEESFAFGAKAKDSRI